MSKQVEHYRIEEKIGEGSYSEVFRGYDLKKDQAVAIKVISLDKIGKNNKIYEFIFQEVY